MNVSRFEDLEIWQDARILCKIIFDITSSGPFSSDFRFRDQIKASSGSAMDNIAEGFNRGGNKEFCQFLSVTIGSIGEARSQSYRAYDFKYIDIEKLNEILDRTESLCRKTYSLMKYLKRCNIQGFKYSNGKP